eukprot:Amastigsp_a513183_18.p5 type:complete len:107 gc:universal Amastigsp_a513183_18:555-235(-)
MSWRASRILCTAAADVSSNTASKPSKRNFGKDATRDWQVETKPSPFQRSQKVDSNTSSSNVVHNARSGAQLWNSPAHPPTSSSRRSAMTCAAAASPLTHAAERLCP